MNIYHVIWRGFPVGRDGRRTTITDHNLPTSIRAASRAEALRALANDVAETGFGLPSRVTIEFIREEEDRPVGVIERENS